MPTCTVSFEDSATRQREKKKIAVVKEIMIQECKRHPHPHFPSPRSLSPSPVSSALKGFFIASRRMHTTRGCTHTRLLPEALVRLPGFRASDAQTLSPSTPARGSRGFRVEGGAGVEGEVDDGGVAGLDFGVGSGRARGGRESG